MNRLPCTSGVLWTVKFWKLMNQNLTIQATESDERYPRSTVFNVLEGQTERFVAGLNTFTSFDAPSRDMRGWSMHIEVSVGSKGNSARNSDIKILSTQLESTPGL